MNTRTALFLLVIGMSVAGPCVPRGAAEGPDEARAALRLQFTRASFRASDPALASKAAAAGGPWTEVAAAARDYDAFLRDFPTLRAEDVAPRVRRLARTLAVGDAELGRVLPLYQSLCVAGPGGVSVCRAPDPGAGPLPPARAAPRLGSLPGDRSSLTQDFGRFADGGGVNAGADPAVAPPPPGPRNGTARTARDYPSAVPRRFSAGLDRGAVPSPDAASATVVARATRGRATAAAAALGPSAVPGADGLSPQDRYMADSLKGLAARDPKAAGAAIYLRQLQALAQAGKPDPEHLRAWETEVASYLKFKSGAAPDVAAPAIPGLKEQEGSGVDEETSENCWQALAPEHPTIARLCSKSPRSAAALAGAYQAVVDQAKGLVSLGNILLILGTLLIGGLLSGGVADVIALLLAIGFSLYMAYKIITEYGPKLVAAIRDLWKSRAGSQESFQKWKETAYFATTTIAAIVMIYLGAKGAEGLSTKLSKMSSPAATGPSFAAMMETMRSPAKLVAEKPGVIPRAAGLMRGSEGVPPMRLVPALRTATAGVATDVAAGVRTAWRNRKRGRTPAVEEKAQGPPVEVSQGPLAEKVLARELTPEQKAAVQAAHETGSGQVGKDGTPAAKGNYTAAQLRAKAAILRKAGFVSADIRALMENGVVGEDRPVVPGGAPVPKPGPAIADEVQLLELNGTVAEKGLGPAVVERADQLSAAAERRRVQASAHPGDSPQYKALMAQSAELEGQARAMRQYSAALAGPEPRLATARQAAPTPVEPIRGLRMTERAAGGTQGGRWFQDAEGNSYFGKNYGGNRERLGSEHAVDQIYRIFDIAAPETQLVQFQGRTWLLSREVGGRVAGSAEALAKTDVRDGFVVDAWLGNRDVIGMGYDNVLIDGGRAVRVDNGGALMWRAMGERKAFGPKVEELASMRDRSYESGTVFGGLTKVDLIGQLRDFVAKYESRRAAVEAAVDRSGVSPELGAQIKQALAERARYLKAVLEKNDPAAPGTVAARAPAREAPPAPPAPASFRASLPDAAGFAADEALLAKNPNGIHVDGKFLPELKYMAKAFHQKVETLYTGQSPTIVRDLLDQGAFLTKAAKEGRVLKDGGGVTAAIQGHVVGGETSYFISTTQRRATAFGDFGQTKGYVLEVKPKETRFYSTRSLSEDALGGATAGHEAEFLAYGAIPEAEIPTVHSTISKVSYQLADPAQVTALRAELAWVEAETAKNGGRLDTFRLRDLWNRRPK